MTGGNLGHLADDGTLYPRSLIHLDCDGNGLRSAPKKHQTFPILSAITDLQVAPGSTF